MNARQFLFFASILLSLSVQSLFAEITDVEKVTDTTDSIASSDFSQQEEETSKSEPLLFPKSAQETLNPITGFPQIEKKPYIIFNEGLSYAFITRIEKQDSRSNFVYEDHLIGAFFSLQTENMRPANSLITVKAFYPFSHGFNGTVQNAKQVILYAVDLFAGPMLQTDMWKYVRIHFAAGLHYMYQLSDAYHLHYVGLGLLAGAELPIASHWTILANGTFTIDNPNLGTNKLVQPFDYAWQYHIDVGLRYSKKSANQFSYIQSRHKQGKKRIKSNEPTPENIETAEVSETPKLTEIGEATTSLDTPPETDDNAQERKAQ